MDANSVTAICATVIAIASLVVSISEARASRRHNFQSVRPMLSLDCLRFDGGLAGIRIQNAGLGPAIIRVATLYLDSEEVGPWEKQAVDPLRGTFAVWPNFTSLRQGRPIPVGQELMIFAVEDYDPVRDAEFWAAVTQRIRIRVQYESVYGNELHEAWFEGSPAHKIGRPWQGRDDAGSSIDKDGHIEPSQSL
ncbi:MULTISPECIES: hypothetical protein [Micromonospora]|uniref:hypothetical protein n=1 Tax=Micromonospora TaxID=1873 RepID=UPI0024A56FFC|nr:hypothetical protein [Micromonospora sp. NBRC 107095]GLZ59494.1 hypothetical protein Misp05_30700 [Micromonospora sp. NBRC 107095]